MAETPFNLSMPDQWAAGVIFASPHSGRNYAPNLMAQTSLNAQEIRSSEDAFIDRLYGDAPRFGAPLLSATVPRAFLDLNRSVEELDAALIEGVKRQATNPRIASGLGVIPRVVANAKAIYDGKITAIEADRRIEEYWLPYHEALCALANQSHAKFGEAIIIDCHSMPHEAISTATARAPLPDVVIGDRFGASADGSIVEMIEAAFASTGLTVARNAPFAGANTAQVYGRPSRRQHVVQIEIDRSLYMDETRVEQRNDFDVLRQAVSHVIAEIMDHCRSRTSLAAE